MTLRDLTPEEVEKLQTKCDSDYVNWKQRNMVPDAFDQLAQRAWRQAFSDGLKAYLAVQAQDEPRPEGGS